MTNILSSDKEELQSYHDRVYSRSSINQLWILVTSKYLMVIVNSRSLKRKSSLQIFYSSTLDTTIPHENLKTCFKECIQNAFYFYTLGSNDASSELTYLVNDGMLELVIIAHFSGSITKETASILPL